MGFFLYCTAALLFYQRQISPMETNKETLKLKLFGRVRIDKALDLARSINTKKNNEQVKKNWDILMRYQLPARHQSTHFPVLSRLKRA